MAGEDADDCHRCIVEVKSFVINDVAVTQACYIKGLDQRRRTTVNGSNRSVMLE